jgi:hypothetical protein
MTQFATTPLHWKRDCHAIVAKVVSFLLLACLSSCLPAGWKESLKEQPVEWQGSVVRNSLSRLLLYVYDGVGGQGTLRRRK